MKECRNASYDVSSVSAEERSFLFAPQRKVKGQRSKSEVFKDDAAAPLVK